jgi:hypothetical protein
MPCERPNQSLEANRWLGAMTSSQHVYEVRPRKDQRGFDLISDRGHNCRQLWLVAFP